MQGTRHIITYGDNRVNTIYSCASDRSEEVTINYLTGVQKTAPDLKWIVLHNADLDADAKALLLGVINNPRMYRVRDGQTEVRPQAWVTVPVSASIGDTISFRLECDREPNADAQVQVEVGGVRTIIPNEGEIELDQEGDVIFLPISPPHECLVSKVTVQ